MSGIGASPANSNGSGTWARAWTHLSIARPTPSYCRVTFSHPPTNTITATTVAEVAELVGLIEEDPDLNVVVFDSANPDFYLTDGTHSWLDLLARLSRAPAVSIASIRGRTRGAGTEFVLACDLRFASRENALLGQLEAGAGEVCAGGSMCRLTRAVGRGRALELLLVADGLDGPRAELYGYVNRTIADGRLDDEVEAIALGLADGDHDAIARAKSRVDEA